MAPKEQIPQNDAALARDLIAWFGRSAREMPWRTEPRDPYRSLVSEFMLQQTQVARVIERFGVFLDRFPTVTDLARADEQDVLGVWSGLGYYRRARLLHACARAIVERHGGVVPSDHKELLDLPGIGAYTAGAIGSIVFNQRTPCVDGNVIRVILRLEGDRSDPGAAKTRSLVTRRVQSLMDSTDDPGALGEGLMELGATVCTPRSPSCGSCPWRGACAARSMDATDEIPTPKTRPVKSDIHAVSIVVRDNAGRYLVEQRPGSGMWARMWQPPTIESDHDEPDPESLAASLGARLGDELGRFTHTTTHRRVHFVVYKGTPRRARTDAVFVTLDELVARGLSNAHRRAVLLDT